MHVEWDPETDGEEKQVWQFDPNDVLRRDAQLIEKHFDGSYDQWVVALQMGKIDARAVLLWYMLKLIHPKLRFDDVPDFRVRQLTVQMGTKELEALLKRVTRMKLKDDEREAFNAQLLVDLEDALGREGNEGLAVRIVDGEVWYGEEQARQELPKAP